MLLYCSSLLAGLLARARGASTRLDHGVLQPLIGAASGLGSDGCWTLALLACETLGEGLEADAATKTEMSPKLKCHKN